MKITAEATDMITTIDGVQVRVWKATTEGGVPCKLFIARISCDENDRAEFEAELKSMPAPREVQMLFALTN